MGSKANLYIFRHGQTDWNEQGRIQGHLDVPLNAKGRSQAQALVAPLRKIGIEALLTSDLARAKESAEIVAEALQLPLFTDPGLREVDFGKLVGLNRQEITEKFGYDFSQRLYKLPFSEQDIQMLNCETAEQVKRRAQDSILSFFETQPKFKKIAVVSHGGVIRRLIHAALGVPDYPMPVPNGLIYPIELQIKKLKWNLTSNPWSKA